LAGMLLEETPVKIAGIHQAVTIDDSQTARRLAHDIRSTAGNMGMKALMGLARAMEEDCTNGRSDRLIELAVAIERAYLAAAAPFSARYADALHDKVDALHASSDR
jgi:HPt (histidine-containing phosphotransfer) domain-containing protein